MNSLILSTSSFFFTHPPTTDIYTLSLHDALPIWCCGVGVAGLQQVQAAAPNVGHGDAGVLTKFADRKSTRLNSSHVRISYAVFCLKKKKAIPVGMLTFAAPID